MRIIAGRYRGKKLAEYYTPSTRPTTDRVKENVFNVLSNRIDFNGIRVLDLFAGTGQYGIKCLSRGAGFVTFNDYDETAVSVIKKNLKTIDGKWTVTNLDFMTALNNAEQYDLIFLDPPYASNLGEQAIEIIKNKKKLAQFGLIVFECDTMGLYPDCKRYGRTNIYFITNG